MIEEALPGWIAKNLLSYLGATRTMIEVHGMPHDAGMPGSKVPDYVTDELTSCYISLNAAINALEAHIAKVGDNEC